MIEYPHMLILKFNLKDILQALRAPARCIRTESDNNSDTSTAFDYPAISPHPIVDRIGDRQKRLETRLYKN